MSLTTLQKVEKLQSALHAKAKGSPNRFYSLYDKICPPTCDVRATAARKEPMDKRSRMSSVDELAEELKRKDYRCSAVRRVWIPKANGKQQPQGIPRIRDWVVQMAAVPILEPIFQADLQPEQYVYRSRKSAHDAIRQVHSLLNTGHTDVVDADLRGYFDSIPHGELMKSVARRVSDKALLHLIKEWLEAPVGDRWEGKPPTDHPPISPLLSNLYMRRFVLGWKTLGHEKQLNVHIVNYADDFVTCCRSTAAEAVIRGYLSTMR